jgi:outer membrane receptor for monomeric catechols
VVPKAILNDQQAYRMQDAVKNVSGVQQRHNDGYDNFIVRDFDLTWVGFRNGGRILLVNLDFANIQQININNISGTEYFHMGVTERRTYLCLSVTYPAITG